MKHTKPFRCCILNCKRQLQGFTSANDRDRHMNSVHKISSGGTLGAVGYDCGYDHCRDNGKIFWRLDNFRNHLKKKHGTKEELDEFLKRYVGFFEYPCTPQDMNLDIQCQKEGAYKLESTTNCLELHGSTLEIRHKGYSFESRR